MTSTADRLEQAIKALPDTEKLRLLDVILADLGRPPLDANWTLDELRRWIEAVEERRGWVHQGR